MVALPVPPSTTCNPEFEVAIYRYFCNITTAPHLRIWMYRFKWLTSEVNLYTAHCKRSQYCAAVSKALNKWVFNRRLNSEFCVWSSERRKVAGKLLKWWTGYSENAISVLARLKSTRRRTGSRWCSFSTAVMWSCRRAAGPVGQLRSAPTVRTEAGGPSRRRTQSCSSPGATNYKPGWLYWPLQLLRVVAGAG